MQTPEQPHDRPTVYGDVSAGKVAPEIEALEKGRERAERKSDEAERREKEAVEGAHIYRVDTNKWILTAFIAILMAGIAIVAFTTGRMTSHWIGLNSELRDLGQRLTVIETIIGQRRPSTQIPRHGLSP